MKFLKSFIDLGQFCNMDKRFNPELSIISGHTILTCNENYAPFEEGNHYKLTLNTEQSLEYLPDTSALKFDSRALFPGTILECKIFLNKQDLEKRVA